MTMGQYYKAIVKEPKSRTWKSFDSWTFGGGAKLMEHSYVPNAMVLYIKDLIFNNPMRVVWGGDYAENEKGKDENLYFLAQEQQVLTTCGIDELTEKLRNEKLPQMLYLVNDSKKQFVNYSRVPQDKWGDAIDPLPLLCAEGNGQGGGDYRGRNMKMVGKWARDFVYVTDELPKGYKEITPNFIEE